jgi:hypothetical protein
LKIKKKKFRQKQEIKYFAVYKNRAEKVENQNNQLKTNNLGKNRVFSLEASKVKICQIIENQ